MKILYINHCSSMYGASRALLNLIKNLKKYPNVEMIVITPNEGDFNIELDKMGIRNYSYPFCWCVYSDEAITTNKMLQEKIERYNLLNKQSIMKIYDRFKDESIDIVHSNSSVIDLGVELSQKLNVAHIWHIRELGHEHYGFKGYNTTAIYEYMNKATESVICVSNCVKKVYEQYVKNNKLLLLYDGIEINQNSQIDEERDKNSFNIIFVGQISRSKNQMELIKAINLLVNEKKYKNIKVDFVGSGDDKYINEIFTYVNNNNLQENVRILGYIDNWQEKAKDYKVGIMCSKCEAFGLVTAEYMLNGLVTVVSNTGANTELVEDNVTGFVYRYGDYKDLSDKVEFIYNNIGALSGIIGAAREKVIHKFNSKLNAEKIFNLYDTIMDNN